MPSRYSYTPPLIPCLHKCFFCGKRLSKARKQDIVSLYWYDMIMDDEVFFFCNKECAKAEYLSHRAKHERDKALNQELNRYIEGGK